MTAITHALKSWVYDTSTYSLQIHVLKNWIMIAITSKYEDDNFYTQIHALKGWIMITKLPMH
jgi:hypothetical protein